MKRLKKLITMIVSLSIVSAAVLSNASAVSVACGAGTVSCDTLNIRANADTSGTIAGTLQRGATVVILDKPNNDWYHVNAGGTAGYVASKYITDVEAAKNFTAAGTLSASDVRLRSTPSVAGTILGTYQTGATLNVIGINNGWFKVTKDGRTGYIRSDFMNLTGSGSAAGAVPAVSTAKTEGQKIADYAQQFAGYAYVYGAESPNVGFDCSGLTYYVYGHFGYSLERRASMQYLDNGVSVSKSNLQPGDLVFFSSDGSGVTHVGLYIGGGKFVNASTERVGVIISDINSSYYTRVWYGAKRIVS